MSQVPDRWFKNMEEFNDFVKWWEWNLKKGNTDVFKKSAFCWLSVWGNYFIPEALLCLGKHPGTSNLMAHCGNGRWMNPKAMIASFMAHFGCQFAVPFEQHTTKKMRDTKGNTVNIIVDRTTRSRVNEVSMMQALSDAIHGPFPRTISAPNYGAFRIAQNYIFTFWINLTSHFISATDLRDKDLILMTVERYDKRIEEIEALSDADCPPPIKVIMKKYTRLAKAKIDGKTTEEVRQRLSDLMFDREEMLHQQEPVQRPLNVW